MSIEVIRHDVIRLGPSIDSKIFEEFMRSELMPFFTAVHGQNNRVNYAVLEQQALLRTSGDERSYLWFTSWSGEAKRLKGRPFEGARVVGGADTRPVLAKLGQFGRRRFSGLWQVIHTDEGRES